MSAERLIACNCYLKYLPPKAAENAMLKPYGQFLLCYPADPNWQSGVYVPAGGINYIRHTLRAVRHSAPTVIRMHSFLRRTIRAGFVAGALLVTTACIDSSAPLPLFDVATLAEVPVIVAEIARQEALPAAAPADAPADAPAPAPAPPVITGYSELAIYEAYRPVSTGNDGTEECTTKKKNCNKKNIKKRAAAAAEQEQKLVNDAAAGAANGAVVTITGHTDYRCDGYKDSINVDCDSPLAMNRATAKAEDVQEGLRQKVPPVESKIVRKAANCPSPPVVCIVRQSEPNVGKTTASGQLSVVGIDRVTIDVCLKATNARETIYETDFNSNIHYGLPCKPRPPGTIDVCLKATNARETIYEADFNSNIHYRLPCKPSPPEIYVCLKSTDARVLIYEADFNSNIHYRLPCKPRPPGTIDVCLKSTNARETIYKADFNSNVHYYLPCKNGAGGDNPDGGNPDDDYNDNPDGGNPDDDYGDNPDGSNPDDDYSDWMPGLLDPGTGKPWIVTVKVSTTSPSYYVANGKKTTLRFTIDVLCGVAREACNAQKHGITFSSPLLTAVQSASKTGVTLNDTRVKPCLTPLSTDCSYYAPQSGKSFGASSGFPLSFYTPLPSGVLAKTSLNVSSTIMREIEFTDGDSLSTRVNFIAEYYVNGVASTSVVAISVLGTKG